MIFGMIRSFRKFGNAIDKLGTVSSAQSESLALNYGQFLEYLKRYCANANVGSIRRFFVFIKVSVGNVRESFGCSI